MAIEVISTIKPKNNGDFPIVEAQDVAVDDKGTRLNEKLENMAVNTPTFDLTDLILPADGSAAVSLEMDTMAIRSALDKGVVEFKITLKLTEIYSCPLSVIPSVTEINNATYSCSAFYNFNTNAQQGVINFMVSDAEVTVWITGIGMGTTGVLPTILQPDQMYFLGEPREVVFGLPNDVPTGKMVYVSFQTSATVIPTVTITTNNHTKVNITPEANKVYEIMGVYNGSMWVMVTHEVSI